jgi:hypothetical protein
LLVAVLAVPFAVGDQAALDLAGESEAFALRVEYDIPLPAGSGTIPHVIGEIRKTSGENAKGLAAAPSNLDAVVGGTIYNPYASVNGNNGSFKLGDTDTGITPPVPPQNRLPATECFYPGATNTTVRWPQDIRAETAPLPPVAYANAQCTPGPQTQLTAWAAAADSPGYATEALGAVVHTGNVAADSLLRPNHGRVESQVRASGEAISILGGVIRIGSVEAEGFSTAEGPGGQATTTSHMAISNITAAGQTFSIADDSLVIAGNKVPIESQEGRGFMDSLNATLDPTGCKLTVLGPANPYPQGYLLSRKPPELGVKDDGTFGASMHGGMLVLCDIPESISEPTTFNPQRAQILIGFAYTMARAAEAPAGFNLGDLVLGGGDPAPITAVAPVTTGPATIRNQPATEPDSGGTNGGPPPQALESPRKIARFEPLGSATRWLLIALGGAMLIGATNFAARRLRELSGG